MAVRILSFDGGGVRGALSVRLLEHLQSPSCGLDLSRITVFAGTSTGSIISGGLACGLTPAELVSLYSNQASSIFSKASVMPFVDMFRAPYVQDGLEALLRTSFRQGADRLLELLGADGDAARGQWRARLEERRRAELLPAVNTYPTLGFLSLLRRYVVIPTFNMWHPTAAPQGAAYCAPVIQHNLPRRTNLLSPTVAAIEMHWLNDVSLVEAVLRSSAAPTYFPGRHNHLDGGVVANNPSLAAWTLVVDGATDLPDKGDVRALSISTGRFPNALQAGRKGKLGWLRPLVDVFIDGGASLASDHCSVLLGPRYHRFSPVLDRQLRSVALDDANAVPFLVQRADTLAGGQVGGGVATAPSEDFVMACQFVRNQFMPSGPFFTGQHDSPPVRARSVQVQDVYERDGSCVTLSHVHGLTGQDRLTIHRDWSAVASGEEAPQITTVELLGSSPRGLVLKSIPSPTGHTYQGTIDLPRGRPSSLTMRTIVRSASARSLQELRRKFPDGVPPSEWTEIETPPDCDYSEWRAAFYCEEAEFRTSFPDNYRIVGQPEGYFIDRRRRLVVRLPSELHPHVEWDPDTFHFKMPNMEPDQTFRLVFRFE